MFPTSFYWTMVEMGMYTIGFHYLLNNFVFPKTQERNEEEEGKRVLQRYSVNLMRSVMCMFFTLQGTKMIGDVWGDVCHEKPDKIEMFKGLHYPFMSYFVFDTIIMFYQKYLKIEKKIRYDLLFHHGIALTALSLIDYYKMYGLSCLISLSEGMSIVSGVKLLIQDGGFKGMRNMMKGLVWYRMMYIVFVRMMFLWPMIFYYYNRITNECEGYKGDRNMYLVAGLLIIIYHADIYWVHSGRKEVKRI